MAGRGHSTFNISTPVVGRGRGLLAQSSTQVIDEGSSEAEGIFEIPPLEPQFSTPVTNNENTMQQLRDLIGEIGSQIGEAITSRLLHSGSHPTPEKSPPSQCVQNETSNTVIDLTKMSLVVKPDIREPPIYRGDGDDRISVHEWIEVMEVYLRKKGFSAEEKTDEILNHLLGKAKSIVKIGLKSSPSTTPVNPEAVYNILRRYFSDIPGSCLPLADFYATQPTANETPVDYWVRLNTAAENADRHLKDQGSSLNKMDAEIAMMFIRNCPDPSLACVFKCKPTTKWTLTEVQEAIDEHQREQQVKRPQATAAKAKVLQIATATAALDHSEPEVEHRQVNTVKITPVSFPSSNDRPAESGALERVLTMLERVLERTAQPVGDTQLQFFPPNRSSPCQVCGNGNHSTRTHCMRERRCLACLEIGHQRRNCPKITDSQRVGGSADQGN
ncbi:uncharacterized protein LOC111610319 [Xiphophorus maculatus]|uniref:uncharacterized protein LOC111610319 n=1 Tax=Xiphophorus maculatus TaxID=8083 RepID=UPI000C6C9465|nr:uncharacterized protein LOC111610319 [Xiphophorus maculatus]